MNVALLTLVLALVWALVSGSFTLINLLFGAAVAGLALYLLRERLGPPVHLVRLRRIIALVWLFIRELVISAVGVAIVVMTPNLKSRLSPGIIAYPLKAKSDAEITLLANLITLTPGTLSIDVSHDRRTLYIHALMLEDKTALIESIASGFEAKVIEVFS